MPAKRLPAPGERALVAASGFTSLWALTWLGSGAVASSGAVTGGFAVGSVVAGSGLTLMWWKMRTMKQIQDANEEDEVQSAKAEAEALALQQAEAERA